MTIRFSLVAAKRAVLTLPLCLVLSGAYAQGQSVITETSSASDTIGERAAWSLEQERAKKAPPPPAAAPAASAVATSIAAPQRAGAAPEYAVTGLRGFVGSLEASYLINGKRATGSTRYPTLVDGWKVVEITPSGSTIEKGRERKLLSFSGASPYQATPVQPMQGAQMSGANPSGLFGQSGLAASVMGFGQAGQPPIPVAVPPGAVIAYPR
jgi:hypothetical protein